MEPTSSPFVGRERELEILRAAVRDAQSGRGGVILVAGDPGIGKTRTISEAVRDLPADRVVWGRCHEGEGAPAYWPWTQALRVHIGRAAPDVLRAELGADASELARVLPAIRERLADVPEAVVRDADSSRFRLFDAMAGFLRRVSAEAPLVLVLDDLHWADSESLLLLRFVAPEIRQTPFVIFGTYRQVEMQQAAPVPHILGDLARVSRRVSLGGLGPDDVGRLVRDGNGLPASDALVATIHRVTEGNPFFIQEVAELLRVDGGSFRIPDSVREAVRRRLAPLPPVARRLLAVGAVLGREFDVALLERAAGLTTTDTLALLARASELGLVQETPGPVGRHRFAHALIQETLHDDLPLAERTELHRRAGDALEALRATDPSPGLGDLARHFFNAGPGSLAKAIDYATRAGDRAFLRLGYEEAAGHYERALQAHVVLRTEPRERIQLLYYFGRAQRRSGDIEGARASFLEMATVARAAGEPFQLALGALALHLTRSDTGRVDHTLVGLLEDALRAMPPEDSMLHVLVMSYLATALYFARDEERREALSREAVAMARRLGDPRSVAHALAQRHFVLWGPTSLEERLAVADEAIRAADEVGDDEIASEARWWRIVDLLEMGNLEALERDIEPYARSADSLRYTRHQWQVALVRAALALLAGRFDEAETLAARAAGMQQEGEENNSAQFYGVQLYTIRREQGRLGELAEAVVASADVDGALPIWRCGLALLRAELGDTAAAKRILGDLAARRFADLPRDGNWIPSLALLAEVCALVGDAQVAAVIHPLLVPHASRNVVVATAAACHGPLTRHLGLLALTAGRPDDAVAHFEAALETSTHLGARPYIAHAAHGLGLALVARGASGDAARASGLFEDAERLARELGMANLLRRLETREVRPAADVPVATDEAAELRREGDFWTLTYGRTVIRLKDSKGVAYLVHLLRHPGHEFHALDLVGDDPDAAGSPDGLTRAADSDAGEVLDAEARASYRRRLVDLRMELEEARGFNDLGRVASIEAEMDALTEALSEGMGIGGRVRRVGSHAERARLNVTRAIGRVLRKIDADSPPLGAYLAATVRTGIFCCYSPDPRRPIAWTL